MKVSKYLVTGLLFLLILTVGMLLKKAGKPYPIALFTIHKLTALAFAVYTVVNLTGLLKNVHTSGLIWGMLVVAGLCVIALFSTGAILSFEKPATQMIFVIHKAAPALLVLSTALSYYLITKK